MPNPGKISFYYQIISLLFLWGISGMLHAQKTREITTVEDRGQTYMTTKVYELKHVLAADIQPVVEGSVRRNNREARTSVLSYKKDGREYIVVSMSREMVPFIDDMIKKLDRQPKGTSEIQATDNIDVSKKTDQVHIINTSNDGDVISRTYILKHADPYEIRGVLRQAVRARRINNKMTGVDGIKYNDGTGAVIVTAEACRFQKQPDGAQSIDELIAMLDQPDIKSNDHDDKILYAPKNRSAADISRELNNVGITRPGDPRELQRGKSRSFVDPELNVIITDTPPYDRKNVREMTEVYDQPIPEISLSYKVYELFEENEEKLGLDYQAWKNGPGAELFTAAAGASNRGTAVFVRFSPKWDTRFLDFMVAESKAKVTNEGTAILQNRKLFNNAAVAGDPDTNRAVIGFNIRVLPFINEEMSTLDLALAFISPLGKDADGNLRTSQSSCSTRVQLLTKGGKMVIGGLESAREEKSETSPGIYEWLFGSKSASVKKSSLIVVIECVPSAKAGIPEKVKKEIDSIKKELKGL